MSNTALVPANGNGTMSLEQKLAAKYGMAEVQVEQSLRGTFFKGLNDGEVVAAKAICNRYDLDPILRQIYCARTGDRLLLMVALDGWVSMAKRTGQFNGWGPVEFDPPKPSTNTQPPEPPVSCTVSVYRKDEQYPTKVTLFFSEWVKNTPNWKSQPYHMLYVKAAKQCLRMAFNISGVDLEDNPQEAEEHAQPIRSIRTLDLKRVDDPEPDPFVSDPALEEARRKAFDHFGKLGISEEKVLQRVGKSNVSEIDDADLTNLREYARTLKHAAKEPPEPGSDGA